MVNEPYPQQNNNKKDIYCSFLHRVHWMQCHFLLFVSDVSGQTLMIHVDEIDEWIRILCFINLLNRRGEIGNDFAFLVVVLV